MATGKAAQVNDALMARASTMVISSPALPIVYAEPGEDYESPEGGEYLVVVNYPNRAAWEGITAGVMDQGLLMVTLVTPKNRGQIAGLELVQEVKDHFPKGHVMASGATSVKVAREPWHTVLPEKHELRFPITIPWSA